jgi:hypothetical protein
MIIAISGGGFNCINHLHVTGWLRRCLLGFQRSRSRSVNQERDLPIRVMEDTLGPLGEIHPMLQYVTRLWWWNITGTSWIAISVTRLNQVWRYRRSNLGYCKYRVVYLCFICASPRSTASTHSYKMKYQEYKGLYYNAWSTNNIVLLQLDKAQSHKLITTLEMTK